LNALAQEHAILRLSINGEIFMSLATPRVKMGVANVPLPQQSFLQPTRLGEESLAKLVLDGIGNAKSVADLFCGIGPFALRLAEQSKVTAIDADKAAIACLQSTVRHTQGLKPLAASTRDLFREPLTVAELRHFNAVVLDPPRAGAEAQARMLAKSTVPRIAMVACDVNSFARDAAILVGGGYRLQKVIPVDQFKWTAHLEMVGIFSKN
jgi:23S rRNA (uracil1939-C5)-methyltransferase